ncbi:MAG: glycosyltransferase [Pseudomonadales bacterium]|nr:glycosyltransferase [Pseudomonadales bacterium]
MAETLESVLGQQLPPNEIIIVDDGSTDNTAEVIAAFGSAVQSVTVANGGPGAARKRAIKGCNNRWIALCDSDDVWCSSHLRRKHEAIVSFPEVNIITSNFESFGPAAVPGQTRLGSAPVGWLQRYTNVQREGFHKIEDPYRATLDFNSLYLSGLVINKELYHAAGGIDLAYRDWQAEDSEFTRRMVAQASACLVIDTDITWGYRRHENNFSATQWKNIYAKARIIQEHIDAGVVASEVLNYAQDEVYRTRGEAFDIAFWTGFYADACGIYSELPRTEKTLKRRVRRVLSYLRNFG